MRWCEPLYLTPPVPLLFYIKIEARQSWLATKVLGGRNRLSKMFPMSVSCVDNGPNIGAIKPFIEPSSGLLMKNQVSGYL